MIFLTDFELMEETLSSLQFISSFRRRDTLFSKVFASTTQ